ncbi:hypothetical protein SLEP1_g41349 [Rubroshorea leprosula]|uniref:Uncharacterized protein n=1 Tax=Rubroshorea leprosula TaxID=152421 RepID=A0AAV5L686_9ROSI|nr:hypothetical protein SLEP1_g41349 [Rubroshorea leprosula]
MEARRECWVWRETEQIFEDNTPAKFRTGRHRNDVLEAFEYERPRDIIKEDIWENNWKKAKKKLEEFLESLKYSTSEG